jgi:hypothetical protein
MFTYLLEKLDNWFERAQQHSLDGYLATSSDLQELERRMRSTERNGYPTQIKWIDVLSAAQRNHDENRPNIPNHLSPSETGASHRRSRIGRNDAISRNRTNLGPRIRPISQPDTRNLGSLPVGPPSPRRWCVWPRAAHVRTGNAQDLDALSWRISALKLTAQHNASVPAFLAARDLDIERLMNFGHLYCFRMTARTGRGVIHAGQRLLVIPQTLSGQIKLLEERLGCRLFGRQEQETQWTLPLWMSHPPSGWALCLHDGRAGRNRRPHLRLILTRHYESVVAAVTSIGIRPESVGLSMPPNLNG